MNPWFNACELQTKARTLSTKTLGAHSPDWAQIIQMECGKNSSQGMLKGEHLASWTFQTTRDRSSFPPRLTFGIFEIWEDLWNEIYISDIWKELRRRRGHLYQMLVSRVNGERGYCSMVSFMSANLWSWLQNCRQQIPLRILNTIQTRRQIAGTKYDYETPGSNPESPKQLQLLSLLIPPELFFCYSERCKRQTGNSTGNHKTNDKENFHLL